MMQHKLIFFLAHVGLAAWAASATWGVLASSGHTLHTVRGAVFDENDMPLKGVKIRIMRKGRTIGRDKSKEKGVYSADYKEGTPINVEYDLRERGIGTVRNLSGKSDQVINKTLRYYETASAVEISSVVAWGAMNRGIVSEMQTRLVKAGYKPGNIEGTLDRGTTKAIDGFQAKRRLPRGGLNAATFKELGLAPPGFLEVPGFEKRMFRWAEPTWNPGQYDPVINSAYFLFFSHRIERALNNEGFDPGNVDGVIDVETLEALGAYQKANTLPTGGLNMATILKLAQ